MTRGRVHPFPVQDRVLCFPLQNYDFRNSAPFRSVGV